MFVIVLVLEAESITGSLLDQVLYLYHSPLLPSRSYGYMLYISCCCRLPQAMLSACFSSGFKFEHFISAFISFNLIHHHLQSSSVLV